MLANVVKMLMANSKTTLVLSLTVLHSKQGNRIRQQYQICARPTFHVIYQESQKPWMQRERSGATSLEMCISLHIRAIWTDAHCVIRLRTVIQPSLVLHLRQDCDINGRE